MLNNITMETKMNVEMLKSKILTFSLVKKDFKKLIVIIYWSYTRQALHPLLRLMGFQ